jgi:hypothetical protein
MEGTFFEDNKQDTLGEAMPRRKPVRRMTAPRTLRKTAMHAMAGVPA